MDMNNINKSQLLGRIIEMVDRQHSKIDAASGTITPGAKERGDGFLEALYQIESLVLNWGINASE